MEVQEELELELDDQIKSACWVRIWGLNRNFYRGIFKT